MQLNKSKDKGIFENLTCKKNYILGMVCDLQQKSKADEYSQTNI